MTHFVDPLCWILTNVLPEDDRLRSETCWSDIWY